MGNIISIISVTCSALSLFVTGVSAAFFVVIKFNDLQHLEKSVGEIKAKLDSIDKKGDKNAEKIANIEGRCSANHGN